jgi:hypothetical protein
LALQNYYLLTSNFDTKPLEEVGNFEELDVFNKQCTELIGSVAFFDSSSSFILPPSSTLMYEN